MCMKTRTRSSCHMYRPFEFSKKKKKKRLNCAQNAPMNFKRKSTSMCGSKTDSCLVFQWLGQDVLLHATQSLYTGRVRTCYCEAGMNLSIPFETKSISIFLCFLSHTVRMPFVNKAGRGKRQCRAKMVENYRTLSLQWLVRVIKKSPSTYPHFSVKTSATAKK